MGNPYFPRLFSPLYFGSLAAKNRLLSAPMGASATAEGGFTEGGILKYEELARGGVGIVCIGETLVHSKTGNNHGKVLRLDNPAVVPSLRLCTRGIHRHGALASVELMHPGRRADPRYSFDGKVYGPSGGMAHYGDGEHYTTEMTQELIDEVVNAFGDAAEMAMIGGCDMVTVQGGHGWLLNQFLSPNTNRRTDRYGGSIENRARIYIEVAENIRKKCGPDFGIDFRLSGMDFMENGATLEDVIELAKMLEPIVDMLHISAASFDSKRASVRMFPVMFLPRGCNGYLAAEIKKHVRVPVVSVGGYGDPAQMERMLEEGLADGFAMARELLADPYMPEKARLGRADDIMLCTRCNECMSVNFVPYVKYAMGSAQCAVNPWCGLTDRTYQPFVRRGNRRVLVVGAGPAGMEAAIGAAACGHSVVLAEKSDSYGGMLRAAWHPAFKKDIRRFVEVLARRIEKKPNIEVRFNTTVTPEYIRELAPDEVIIAIGAEPAVPEIPGANSPKVVLAPEIHEKELGQKVVFIGGGMVGCEEGIAAAKYGNKDVTIVEQTGTICRGAPYIHYLGIITELEQLDNVRLLLKSTVTAITEKGVIVRAEDGSVQELEADSVVMCAGMRPKKDEAWRLLQAAQSAVIVGDAKKPARMNEAVTDGYFAGFNLQKLDPVFDNM